MLIRGLKYIGNKQVGELAVLILAPTDSRRKQRFNKGEVKLVGKDIDLRIAEYLASEYRGVVEFIEVEVDAKLVLKEKLQDLHSYFAKYVNNGELSTEDAHLIFCEVFNVEELKVHQENKELKAALKELSDLKNEQKEPALEKKTPAKKKTGMQRKKKASSKAK